MQARRALDRANTSRLPCMHRIHFLLDLSKLFLEKKFVHRSRELDLRSGYGFYRLRFRYLSSRVSPL